MLDLATLRTQRAQMEILHPKTGEAVGLRLELLPPDSPEIKAKVRTLRDAVMHKARRNVPVSSADTERNSVELCSVAVVGWEWHGEGTWNGEKPSFNRATLAEMLAVDWLRQQVDDYLGDQKNFF